MKNLLMLTFAVFVFSTNSYAGIVIQPQESVFVASEDLNYSFNLMDEKTKKFLNENDLIETHTKLLHLVVYDKSLNEFNHVHPEFNGSSWNASLNLPTNGNYLVWAQGETKSGTEFSVSTLMTVKNGQVEASVASLGDVRTGVDGSTKIDLAPIKIKAGKMVMINFEVSRTDSSTSEITPYLGAYAHVIATALDSNELIHVHPMQGDKANSGMLHATFPISGDYRLWLQLVDGGVLKTIPLSVAVE